MRTILFVSISQALYAELLSASFDADSSRAVAEMQARFDIERKQRDIELLEERQRISDLELRQQRNARWALVVGFAGLFIVLLLIFNRNRLKSRQALMAETVRQEREISTRLRAVDKLKDEILANTSHELRTPLDRAGARRHRPGPGGDPQAGGAPRRRPGGGVDAGGRLDVLLRPPRRRG